ncbi:MAG: alkaline phosphatase family protein [Acidobacteriota bacterium]
MRRLTKAAAGLAFILWLIELHALEAQAYIGPGAGFVFVSSFLVLLLALFSALFYLLSWPFRWMLRALRRRTKGTGSTPIAKRVIVLGLDGFDPTLAAQYMRAGKLPHFQKLRDEGSFSLLASSYPSISPVAWSSFMTGVDASHHNIFDFLTRDPCTYQPVLSSAEVGQARRTLPIGKYLVPLGRPTLKMKRKSKPFWQVLGEHDVFSSVIRVPITFPAEPFNGVLLSGMCTPDLRGSQGTFSFYTTDPTDSRGQTGGVRFPVTREGNLIRTALVGPRNSLKKSPENLTLPMLIQLDSGPERCTIEVSGTRFEVQVGNYSPWIRVAFRAGLGVKVHGICRFYLVRLSPHFELYVSPIHIDPERPALPISHPFVYSVYLAKLLGPFGTLGLAEDTWALNEGVLNEDAFLKQAYLFFEERERMFFSALERTPRGLCTCVFDTSDRIQHMFFRCLDPQHPANRGKELDRYRGVIEELYGRMDQLLGNVLEKVQEGDVLMVISDHGFTHFKRGVNLNTWLLENGYLFLTDGKTTCGDWFEGVDWSRTRAFSLGLAGVFINRKGRESAGIVAEGAELRELKREMASQLTSLIDPTTGEKAIRRVIDVEATFKGPYQYDAPDLLIGYNAGYRSSWGCATGRVTESVFEDNLKHWSGDHCVDPEVVPGVFFSNRSIVQAHPDLRDIAPTVLRLLGVPIPSYMKGRALMEHSPTSGR